MCVCVYSYMMAIQYVLLTDSDIKAQSGSSTIGESVPS